MNPLLACGLAVALWAPSTPAEVSFETLLNEMTDLSHLARLPAPGYMCRQFSSYDRASVSPTENWFANDDAGNYLRTEERCGRTEFVMMDADGPGAIVRIWSANPEGVLRVYLDRYPEPVIEVSMQDWLGGQTQWAPPPIAEQCSRGWNSYLPIPYAKHCKVTSDAGNFYYHVNYRTYDPGTAVRTWSAAEAEAAAPRIAEIASRLASPHGATSPDAQSGGDLTEVVLPPGAGRCIADLAGPAAITAIRFGAIEAVDTATALRTTVLSMDFDGEATVITPLGDFFGAAPGLNPYESLPFAVTEEGTLSCRWVMPFANRAVVRLTNRGKAPVAITASVSTTPYKWDDRSLHFHAKWRASPDHASQPPHDWNLVVAKGVGVFVGTAMFVANPVREWWGEGDEKIRLDGEGFPSHFGTGTEDYFGYAWCSNEPFMHAYHNQPRCDGPGNYGYTAVNRWHVLDAIPFTRSIRFDMEIWHWVDCRMGLAATCYWYARPGATDNFAELREDDLRIPVLPPYVRHRVEGVLEAESLRVVRAEGPVQSQELQLCSNEEQLWWRPQRPGARLVLAFPVEQAGRYRVLGRFVTAQDYGIVQLGVNGVPAGRPLDLYGEFVDGTDPIDLGSYTLQQGENTLTVDLVQRNMHSSSYYFGFDYMKLERVD